MSGTPICGDCEVAMMPARGYHAVLAYKPLRGLSFKRFSPVSLYVCTRCGQIRFYLARPESAPEAAEAPAYRYRVRINRDPTRGGQPRPEPAP